MNTFFLGVWQQLRASLLSTFGFLDDGGDSLTVIMGRMASRVIVALLLILIFVLVYRGLRFILRWAVLRFRIPRDFSRPLAIGLRYMLTLLTLIAVLSQWGVKAKYISGLGQAGFMAFVYYVGWLIGIRMMTRALRRYDLDPSIVQLLRNMASVVIFAFAVASVLAQFGVNVVSLITGLGVIGIAVGFAAQDTLANFIAGTTLLLERPFRIGDWVQINEQIGRVQEITLRNTRLITRDNIHTSIPNASVSTSEVINYSAGGPLRLMVPLGVAYQVDIAAVRSVLLEVVKADERVIKYPEPSMRVDELKDSSVKVGLYFWVAARDIAVEPRIRADILEASKLALDAAGIEIPFPHLQLYLDEAKGLEPYLSQREG